MDNNTWHFEPANTFITTITVDAFKTPHQFKSCQFPQTLTNFANLSQLGVNIIQEQKNEENGNESLDKYIN